MPCVENPQNPIPENQLYNEMIGQLPSYLQSKTAPPLQRDIPVDCHVCYQTLFTKSMDQKINVHVAISRRKP